MSLLSPDELRLYLTPGRAVAVRVQGWLQKRVAAKQDYRIAAAEDAGWRAALPPFEAALRELGAGADRLTVLLGGDLNQVQLLTVREDLATDEEQRGYARHRFAQVFGAAAEAWDVRVSLEPPGAPRVAAAIETQLVSELATRADAARIRLASVQPILMAAFNTWRGQLASRSAWLVVAEEWRLTLAFISAGNWKWLRTQRADADWPAQLSELIAREASLAGIEAQGADVLVFSPEHGSLSLPAGYPLPVRQLQLPAMRGFSPLTDAAFGVALVG